MNTVPKKIQPAWIEKANARSRFDPKSGCWLYERGEIVHNGYGRVFYMGKPRRVHRLSYEYFCGEVPSGMMVCHKCDVRNCWNPGHLFLGTSKDNHNDRIAKGRRIPKYTRERHPAQKTGVELTRSKRNGNAKLIAENIPEIRDLFGSGRKSFRAIGRKFGVSHKTIIDVIDGKTWRHI